MHGNPLVAEDTAFFYNFLYATPGRILDFSKLPCLQVGNFVHKWVVKFGAKNAVRCTLLGGCLI